MKELAAPKLVVRLLVWAPAAAIVVSAAAVTGGVALFLGPLLALLYGVVCLVAWQSAGFEEVE